MFLHAIKGVSGNLYQFEICTKNKKFNDILAVYIFAKQTNFGFEYLYIGETETLETRINSHEKWECANNHGLTHILFHKTISKKQGKDIEKDLLRKHITPCNEKLQGVAGFLFR